MAKGTAEVLRGRETQEEFDERFRETDGAMIQRVMAPLMGRRGIIVLTTRRTIATSTSRISPRRN